MKVLILGQGYIGSFLNKYLSDHFRTSCFKQCALDYTNKNDISNFLAATNWDVVVNCSGFTGVPNVDNCEEEKNKCWFYNVVAPHTVLLAADKYGIPVIHVSSGCIYTGYERQFTENDEPNFGLYNSASSYYSKTKHAFETIAKNFNACILRVRMPFDGTLNRKNYINKIFKYDNLISQPNSITSVTDLSDLIKQIILNVKNMPVGPLNAVNHGSVEANQVVDMLKSEGVSNPNWQIIDIKNLNTVAQRSNCVLDSYKLFSLGYNMPTSLQSLERDVKEFAAQIKQAQA